MSRRYTRKFRRKFSSPRRRRKSSFRRKQSRLAKSQMARGRYF